MEEKKVGAGSECPELEHGIFHEPEASLLGGSEPWTIRKQSETRTRGVNVIIKDNCVSCREANPNNARMRSDS